MNPIVLPFADNQIFFRARRQAAFIVDGVVTEVAFYRRKERDPKGLSVATTRQVAERDLTRVRDTITIEAHQIRGIRDENNVALYIEPDGIEGKANILDPPFFDDPDDKKAAEGIRLAKLLALLAIAHPDPR
jgi:hypothetical protein